MQHSFDIDIAEKYGIKAAIILNNLQYWIEKNKANEKNYFDGNFWTYNSAKAFQVLFKYMSEKEIRTALKILIDEGLIITGNYNSNCYDHTLWYAITEKGNSILQKVYIDETKSIDQNDKKDTPYTDINANINANINQRERTSRFTPPSEFEVAQYITELKNSGKEVDFTAEYFINNNTARGWMIGKNKMKDWKAAVRTWIINGQKFKAGKKSTAREYSVNADEFNDMYGGIK